MKLIRRNISAKDGSGSIHLKPEHPEDLWHAYNLLQTDDRVRSSTLRKVINTSSTGSTTSNKVRTSITVRVDKVDFDPEVMTLRLSGPNVVESKVVKMGAYHTLTLELGTDFWIEKECWDQIFLDTVKDACNPEREAEVAALVMQSGLAHLCIVTGSITIVKAKIEKSIPKKRTGSSNHTKAVTKFYEAVYQAVLRDLDFSKIKCLLCASPGYVKDDFHRYMQAQAKLKDDRDLLDNMGKVVLCKASSGHKHALEEVFRDPSILEQMAETKVAKEVAVLNRFMRMLDQNPDKAQFGYTHVQKAHDELAVDSLLVTDELFRSSDIATRKKYVQLVESVRENGGKVFIFSSLHVSGTQLQHFSGVAAILRYPLPDLDQLELDAASSDEDDSDVDEDKEKDVASCNNVEESMLHEDVF